MDARELVKFIRSNPDEEQSVRMLNKAFQNYWLRGHDKRNWLELRLKSTRDKMTRLYEEEMEQIREVVARNGYSGEHLDIQSMKLYLKDTPITEDDVKPKSK